MNPLRPRSNANLTKNPRTAAMQPNDYIDISLPPPGPRTGRIFLGVVLIVLGLIGGTIWTLAINLGETFSRAEKGQEVPVPFATILTAIASLLLITGGVFLIRSGSSSAQQIVSAGKTMMTAALVTIGISAAVYIFGFLVCLAEQ
jgi:hypothetical protein